MLRSKLIAFIAALLIAPMSALAACNPPNAPVGSVGCYPDRITTLGPIQGTDLLTDWVPSALPNSLTTITVAELVAYLGTQAGFVTGPFTTTVGFIPAWANTSGTQLSTGTPFGTSGANTLVETLGTGLLNPAIIPPPGVATLGGIESASFVSHEWVQYIDTSGVQHQSQPAIGDLASQAANTVNGNFTSGSAPPSANSMPPCNDAAGNHLNYTSGTGISCGNSTSGLTLSGTGQAFTGGIHPTAFSNGTGSGAGTITVDCGNGPIQTITNGGNFTLAMSANDGECMVRVTNNASAGTITFSGFSEGTNTGDALTTANTSKFDISLTRIGGNPHYLISALQ